METAFENYKLLCVHCVCLKAGLLSYVNSKEAHGALSHQCACTKIWTGSQTSNLKTSSLLYASQQAAQDKHSLGRFHTEMIYIAFHHVKVSEWLSFFKNTGHSTLDELPPDRSADPALAAIRLYRWTRYTMLDALPTHECLLISSNCAQLLCLLQKCASLTISSLNPVPSRATEQCVYAGHKN